MSKVIVQVIGGLVQAVFSTDPEVEIVVLDYDTEGADEDEIMPLSELEELMGEDKAKSVDFRSGIFEDDLYSVIEKGE